MTGAFKLKPDDQVTALPAQTGALRLGTQDVVEDVPVPGETMLQRNARLQAADAARENVSTGEAFGHGFGQGASLGWFDEILAGAQALGEGRSLEGIKGAYKANVAMERARLHSAEEQHPIATTLGNVAGGIATAAVLPAGPLAGVARGAGLGARFAVNAARGAGAGILSGAGTSEASDIPGIIQDAAKGGLVGGAVGGVLGTASERLLGGAQGRIDKRLTSDITGGRATAAGKKIYRNEDLVTSTAKKFNLDGIAEDPVQLQQATRAAMQPVGAELGAVRQKVGEEALGVRVKDLREATRSVAKDYNAPSEAPLRKRIEAFVSDMDDRWGSGARDRVSISDLNNQIGIMEKTGFAGADLHPTAAKQLQRDLASAFEDVMQSRLDEIKDLGGRIANSALAKREGFRGISEAAEAAKKLPELNRDYRGLKLILAAAEDRAGLPPASRAAGGLRNAVNNAVDMGLLFTHPVGYLAKKGAMVAGPALARGADRMLAGLYAAAQNGQLTAQMIQQALEVGVPRGIVERLANSVSTQP